MSQYNDPQDRYMDTETVAEYLMMSPNTIRKWCRKKQIPFIKVEGSKLVRFLKSEIDEWMKRGMRVAEPQGEYKHNGRTEKKKRQEGTLRS
jgi:excisionase family DNA binding protein